MFYTNIKPLYIFRKKAKALKELADKECEKRVKEYMKRQQQRPVHDYSDMKPSSKQTLVSSKSSNMLSTLKQKIWSSQGNLNKTPREPAASPVAPSFVPAQQRHQAGVTKFSDLVGSGSSSSGGSTIASRMGTVQKKPSMQLKQQQPPPPHHQQQQHMKLSQHSSACPHAASTVDGGFKVRELEADGKRTITSLTGLQRDSEVLYVGTFSSTEEQSQGKRGKIADVFEVDDEGNERSGGYSSALSRSFSQPDILGDVQLAQELNEELQVQLQRPLGLFDRPTMLGSIAFRRSVTAALSQLQLQAADDSVDSISSSTMRNATSSHHNNSNNNKSRSNGNKARLYLNLSDDSDSEGDGEDVYSDDEDEETTASALQRFLTVWALDEYLPV